MLVCACVRVFLCRLLHKPILDSNIRMNEWDFIYFLFEYSNSLLTWGANSKRYCCNHVVSVCMFYMHLNRQDVELLSPLIYLLFTFCFPQLFTFLNEFGFVFGRTKLLCP